MKLTRRSFVQHTSAMIAAGAVATGSKAIAQTAPVRIGFMGGLTGPNSSFGIQYLRGAQFAVDEIRRAGGTAAESVELVPRDTQGDPTKAVNAAQEMISRLKTNVILGPSGTGESLAIMGIMARGKMPNINPTSADAIIDPAKYPNAFRVAGHIAQWDEAVRYYGTQVLKSKSIAVIGDNGGFGTTAVAQTAAALKESGIQVAYQAQVDPNQPDLRPDLLRAREGGATAVIVWTSALGLATRMMNARAAMDWDVPFIGHPGLGIGDILRLLDKPGNWENVYIVTNKSCCFDDAGKLPSRTEEFVQKLNSGNVQISDSTLWWIGCGYDSVKLVMAAVKESGTTKPEELIKYWETLGNFPGISGDFKFSPQEHNGLPTAQLVMARANSQKNGCFTLAPGYS